MEEMQSIEKLVAELKALLKVAQDKDLLGVHKKIVEKAAIIKEKYRNNEDPSASFESYELWHVLVGSTLTKPLKKLDFPGEDSIEKFIRSL